MRRASMACTLIAACPLFAQHAIVTTEDSGSALIGVVNTQTKQADTFINIGSIAASGLVISGDGTHAYAGLSGYLLIDYINLSTGAVEAQLPVPDGAPEALAINPAGTRIYAAYEGNDYQFTVATYDARSNRLIQTAAVSGGGTPIYTAEFGFSSDQKTLFVAFQGFSILQIDALTGALLSNTPITYDPLGLSVSASGNVLAVTASITQRATIFLLDPATLTETSSITVPGECAESIAVDAAGQYAYVVTSASCSPFAAADILKVDLQTGAVVAKSPTRSSAFAVELSPDQSELYVGETDNVTEISTSSFTVAAEYVQPGPVNAIATNPGGNRVYTSNSVQSLLSYVAEGSVQTGISLSVSPASPAANQWGIATTSDGTLSFINSLESAAITVVDNQERKVKQFLASPVYPNLIAVASPSGPLFVVSVSKFSNTPSKLTAVDVTTGKAIHQTPLLEFGQTAIAVSPDGTQVWVTSGHDDLVAVYDASTLQLIGSFPATGPYALAFSSDSRHCYITLFNNNTGILDVDTKTLTINRTLAPSISVPSSIAVSPDNQTLYVIGDGGTLYTVRAADGEILSSVVVGSASHIDFLVLSADGNNVYVADEANLRVYDTQTLKVTGSVTLAKEIVSLSFTAF